MGRKILAVVVALIVATAVMMIVEMVNWYNIKPPSADVMNDPAKMREYMANGSALAYAVVIFGYILGSFVGGFIVTKISRQVSKGMTLPIIVGVLLMLLGITNFLMLPGQPIWFMAAALAVFIPLSLFGYRLAR
jgi:MFS family permease